MNKFNIGDVVRLKSGSQDMVVDFVFECGTAKCVFKYSHLFHPECLEISPRNLTNQAEGLEIVPRDLINRLFQAGKTWENNMNKFIIGDVVRLKSGGQDMVVDFVFEDDRVVSCKNCVLKDSCYSQSSYSSLSVCSSSIYDVELLEISPRNLINQIDRIKKLLIEMSEYDNEAGHAMVNGWQARAESILGFAGINKTHTTQ